MAESRLLRRENIFTNKTKNLLAETCYFSQTSLMRLLSQISLAILVFALASPAYSQERAGTTLMRAFATAFKTKVAKHEAVQEAKKVRYPEPVQCASGDCYYGGNVARPDTPTGGKLKPFNASSSYSSNGRVLYKHNNTVFEEPHQPKIDPHFTPELPPLPDLRTPAQVTKTEKRRLKLQQRFAERRLREATLRAQQKAAQAARYQSYQQQGF